MSHYTGFTGSFSDRYSASRHSSDFEGSDSASAGSSKTHHKGAEKDRIRDYVGSLSPETASSVTMRCMVVRSYLPGQNWVTLEHPDYQFSLGGRSTAILFEPRKTDVREHLDAPIQMKWIRQWRPNKNQAQITDSQWIRVESESRIRESLSSSSKHGKNTSGPLGALTNTMVINISQDDRGETQPTCSFSTMNLFEDFRRTLQHQAEARSRYSSSSSKRKHQIVHLQVADEVDHTAVDEEMRRFITTVTVAAAVADKFSSKSRSTKEIEGSVEVKEGEAAAAPKKSPIERTLSSSPKEIEDSAEVKKGEAVPAPEKTFLGQFKPSTFLPCQSGVVIVTSDLPKGHQISVTMDEHFAVWLDGKSYFPFQNQLLAYTVDPQSTSFEITWAYPKRRGAQGRETVATLYLPSMIDTLKERERRPTHRDVVGTLVSVPVMHLSLNSAQRPQMEFSTDNYYARLVQRELAVRQRPQSEPLPSELNQFKGFRLVKDTWKQDSRSEKWEKCEARSEDEQLQELTTRCIERCRVHVDHMKKKQAQLERQQSRERYLADIDD